MYNSTYFIGKLIKKAGGAVKSVAKKAVGAMLSSSPRRSEDKQKDKEVRK